MRGNFNVKNASEIDNAPHRRDPARMGRRNTNVINPLVLNEILAIPDAVVSFANRQRRRGMFTNKPVVLLVLRDACIFQEH